MSSKRMELAGLWNGTTPSMVRHHCIKPCRSCWHLAVHDARMWSSSAIAQSISMLLASQGLTACCGGLLENDVFQIASDSP